MTKTFSIPFVYILIFLVSKEVFSYESEKVVVLCLLTFFVTSYYYLRTILHENFVSTSEKLEEEIDQLLTLRAELEKKIKIFWRAYIRLEEVLVEICFWVKKNFQTVVKKANVNRILFNFHVIKDQLNMILTETLVTKHLFKQLYLTIVINNFYFLLNSKLNNSSVSLDINTFLDKLKSSKNEVTFENLITSSNLNREFYDSETKTFVNFENVVFSWVEDKNNLKEWKTSWFDKF